MSPGELTLVAAAGAVGAVARAELAARARTDWRGVVAANVAGAFLLGLVASLATGVWLPVLGGGLLGSFTTFSTWVAVADRDLARPWGGLAASLVAGLFAAAAAVWLASRLPGATP